jgi:hypothetical protein
LEFIDRYKRAFKPWKVTAERVYNTDVTGISTFVLFSNFVAQIGTKQVGQIVSGK